MSKVGGVTAAEALLSSVLGHPHEASEVSEFILSEQLELPHDKSAPVSPQEDTLRSPSQEGQEQVCSLVSPTLCDLHGGENMPMCQDGVAPS